LTSSLFAFLLVAIGGYFGTSSTAKQITGSEVGVAYHVVQLVAWLIAGFVGGFVAGYRAAGKGWVAGSLVGFYTVVGFLGLLYWLLSSQGLGVGDLFLLPAEGEQASFAAVIVAILALNIPACAYGGMLGDRYYRETGHLEDPTRHTLFHVPWWHWVWILIFFPLVVVTDLVLSGHLLFLGLRLFLTRIIHFLLEDSGTLLTLLLEIAPIIGFAATAYGVQNLWDALSVRTEMETRKRVAKAVWGFVLLVFIVTIVWRIASSMLISAIGEP